MSIASKKPYGIKGILNPASAFKDVRDDIDYGGGVVVSIENSVFEVGYDRESDKDIAKEIANDFVRSWAFRNSLKINIDFNVSWKPSQTGKTIGLEIKDGVHAHDRTIMTTIAVLPARYVVATADSYSFKTDFDIAKKAQKDRTLSVVLNYYYGEVIDSEMPKVGVYRIIEELSNKIGGDRNLALLVGKTEKFINDIRQTCQEHRHSRLRVLSMGANPVLSAQECVARSKELIQAYAASLPMC